jgi:molybdate transport system substrate-binding protein
MAIAGCSRGTPEGAARPPAELLVFGAASLGEVLQDAAREYERRPGSPRIRLSLGGSSVLGRQLAATPRADAFVSADDEPLDRLERQGLIVAGSRRWIARNDLVAITSAGGSGGPGDACALADHPPERLFLGDPESAPVGKYARQFLQGVVCAGATDPWSRLRDRVVTASNVRVVLAQVEASERGIGFVYRTDARSSSRVRVLFAATGPAAPRVRYSAAAIAGGPAPEAGRAFVEFLGGPEGQALFARHGFTASAEARR